METQAPLASSPGRFTQSATADIAAFAIATLDPSQSNGSDEPTRLWLGRAKGQATFQTPTLGGLFPPTIVPTSFGKRREQERVAHRGGRHRR